MIKVKYLIPQYIVELIEKPIAVMFRTFILMSLRFLPIFFKEKAIIDSRWWFMIDHIKSSINKTKAINCLYTYTYMYMGFINIKNNY